MIEALGLGKDFGAVRALDGLDLDVGEAEFFGFLGPNGAGKTTTVHILATLLRPTRGSARIAGHDVVRESLAVRKSIGLVFQEPTLDRDLTVEENLRFAARLWDLPGGAARARTDELLRQFGLAERRDSPVRALSGGLRRAADIARGVAHRATARRGGRGAGSAGARPLAMARAVWGIVAREFVRFLRQRGRLVSSLARPFVWFVFAGAGFRALFAGPPGLDYPRYMAPGLLGMVVLFGAFLAALSTVTDRDAGVLRLLLVAPVPRGAATGPRLSEPDRLRGGPAEARVARALERSGLRGRAGGWMRLRGARRLCGVGARRGDAAAGARGRRHARRVFRRAALGAEHSSHRLEDEDQHQRYDDRDQPVRSGLLRGVGGDLHHDRRCQGEQPQRVHESQEHEQAELGNEEQNREEPGRRARVGGELERLHAGRLGSEARRHDVERDRELVHARQPQDVVGHRALQGRAERRVHRAEHGADLAEDQRPEQGGDRPDGAERYHIALVDRARVRELAADRAPLVPRPKQHVARAPHQRAARSLGECRLRRGGGLGRWRLRWAGWPRPRRSGGSGGRLAGRGGHASSNIGSN